MSWIRSSEVLIRSPHGAFLAKKLPDIQGVNSVMLIVFNKDNGVRNIYFHSSITSVNLSHCKFTSQVSVSRLYQSTPRR